MTRYQSLRKRRVKAMAYVIVPLELVREGGMVLSVDLDGKGKKVLGRA